MQKTVFEITKMDCPSEENLIRLKLGSIESISHLEFDLEHRMLIVFHLERIDQIEQAIIELNLGGKVISSERSEQANFEEDKNQSRLLWYILIINFIFFIHSAFPILYQL